MHSEIDDGLDAFPERIRQAHKHSTRHRTEIERSDLCGCFYCCATFAPGQIEDWVDKDDTGEGQTALCPCCGIDSVIGSRSGFPIERGFLEEMRLYWF